LQPKANAIKERNGGPTQPTLSWWVPTLSLNFSKQCVHIPNSTAQCNDFKPFSTLHTPCTTQSNQSFISSYHAFTTLKSKVSYTQKSQCRYNQCVLHLIIICLEFSFFSYFNVDVPLYHIDKRLSKTCIITSKVI